MKRKIYYPKQVCCQKITFDYEDGKLYNLSFEAGCQGNLGAISKVCEGMELTKIIDLFCDNRCGYRQTSCVDQLSKAVKEVLE